MIAHGQMFYAGDAVHRHPPNDGLGSNAWIQDSSTWPGSSATWQRAKPGPLC